MQRPTVKGWCRRPRRAAKIVSSNPKVGEASANHCPAPRARYRELPNRQLKIRWAAQYAATAPAICAQRIRSAIATAVSRRNANATLDGRIEMRAGKRPENQESARQNRAGGMAVQRRASATFRPKASGHVCPSRPRPQAGRPCQPFAKDALCQRRLSCRRPSIDDPFAVFLTNSRIGPAATQVRLPRPA